MHFRLIYVYGKSQIKNKCKLNNNYHGPKCVAYIAQKFTCMRPKLILTFDAVFSYRVNKLCVKLEGITFNLYCAYSFTAMGPKFT